MVRCVAQRRLEPLGETGAEPDHPCSGDPPETDLAGIGMSGRHPYVEGNRRCGQSRRHFSVWKWLFPARRKTSAPVVEAARPTPVSPLGDGSERLAARSAAPLPAAPAAPSDLGAAAAAGAAYVFVAEAALHVPHPAAAPDQGALHTPANDASFHAPPPAGGDPAEPHDATPTPAAGSHAGHGHGHAPHGSDGTHGAALDGGAGLTGHQTSGDSASGPSYDTGSGSPHTSGGGSPGY